MVAKANNTLDTHLDDNNHIRNYMEGDISGFELLKNKYDQFLYDFIELHVGENSPMTLEIHLETLEVTQKYLEIFTFHCSFSTLLYSIATNCIAKRKREYNFSPF